MLPGLRDEVRRLIRECEPPSIEEEQAAEAERMLSEYARNPPARES
jgi:hypothetical protein